MSENEAPDLVIARFQDYFGRRSFWQRRLWAPGTVMLLQEAAEAADMFQRGLLREGLLKQLASSATIQAGSDLGLGGPGTRNSIRQALATLATEPRIAKYQLDLLVEDAPTSYLTNWHREFEKNPAAKPTENISRLVAGHLLGLGFSPEKLHRWSRWLEKGRRPASVAEILDEASTIAAAVARTWTVLVPVLSLGRYEQEMPVEWLNASETANWLVERGHSGVERHNGGFLLDAHALDPWSAVEIVSDELESLSARLTVGTVGAVSFRLTGVAYVEGQSTTFSLDRPRRQVDVPSLMRQDSLFRIKSPALAGR